MKFSIIVPIYNIEEYLPKCLESITNQTHKDFEVLLVDDGSPDNSAQICKEYEAKDSRFKHLKKKMVDFQMQEIMVLNMQRENMFSF